MSESRGGYRPPEAEGPKIEERDREPKLPRADEATTELAAEAPTAPTKKEETKTGRGRELGEYTRAELAAEVRRYLAEMEAQPERERMAEVLNALWEKLTNTEREKLAKNLRELMGRLMKEGHPFAAIFEAVTEALRLILKAVDKRGK